MKAKYRINKDDLIENIVLIGIFIFISFISIGLIKDLLIEDLLKKDTFFKAVYPFVPIGYNFFSVSAANISEGLFNSHDQNTHQILCAILMYLCLLICAIGFWAGYRLWIKKSPMKYATTKFYIINTAVFCVSAMLIHLLIGCIIQKQYIAIGNKTVDESVTINNSVFVILILICLIVHIVTIVFNVRVLNWLRGILFTLVLETLISFGQYIFLTAFIVGGMLLMAGVIIFVIFIKFGDKTSSDSYSSSYNSSATSHKTQLDYNNHYDTIGNNDYGFEYMGKYSNGKHRFYNRETGEEFYGYYSSDGRLLREDTNEEIKSW